MKIILLLTGLSLSILSCSIGKQIPEAEFTTFILMSTDTIKNLSGDRYSYTWLDRTNNVRYSVFIDHPLPYDKGQTLTGLIRR